MQPFRQHHQMDAQQAHVVWNDLNRAIDEIYNKNASLLSFEELYR
jgi:cullin 3